MNEVRQALFGMTAFLIFNSYQQSQGGKYECRVAVPGNNLQRVTVFIVECYPLGVAVDYVYKDRQSIPRM